MKKFSGSVVVGLLLMSGLAVAGGDIAPVEPEVVVPPPPVVDDSGFYLGVAYTRAKYKEDYSWLTETDTIGVTAALPVFGPMDAYEGSGTEEVDYNGIMAQAGYKFNKYLAVEGRYWWSLGDGDWSWSESYPKGDTASDSGSSGNEELRAWGIYLKPMYPVTEQFDIYALLGGGNVTLSNDNLGDWLDESDFQWGLGASYDITENLSIFADYVRLLDKDGSSITKGEMGLVTTNWDDTVYTINVGLTYKF